MPNIFLKFFRRLRIVHIRFFFQRAPQINVSGIEVGWSRRPQSGLFAPTELFALCSTAFYCIKRMYDFSSSVGLTKKGDKSHIAFGICFVKEGGGGAVILRD
jgi:hypothetical protein